MILVWKPLALEDRVQIMEFIGADNPLAAIELDLAFESKADALPAHPTMYKPGRVKGTREIVVHPNYVMVYAITGKTIGILRLLHAARQWP